MPNPDGEPYRFEITSTEITIGLYKSLKQSDGFDNESIRHLPLNSQHLIEQSTKSIDFEIAHFCNHLSLLDGIPKSELCYSFNEDETEYYLNIDRTGYRIPTVDEWQIACNGSNWNKQFTAICNSTKVTDDFEPTYRMQRHAWLQNNSQTEQQVVAKKLPNPNGLFDMYGNVEELVATTLGSRRAIASKELKYRLIGLRVLNEPNLLRRRVINNTEAGPHERDQVHYATGFRLVRTSKEN
jgi:hypothetical protein